MSREENFNKYFKPKLLSEKLTPRIVSDLNKYPPKELESKKCLETLLEQKSIYLYGDVRLGKTLLASDSLMKFLGHSYINHLGKTAKFISFPELIMELKSTFDSKELNESDIINKYCEFDLLVLDEFGLMVLSDWLFNVLYIIINRRYEEMKPTIYTSNISLKQMMVKLKDKRIPRRIMDSCGIIYHMEK